MTLLEDQTIPSMPLGELYTAECLQELPSHARLEIIRGELCTMPNNSAEHGNKTARLSGRVITFVEDNELGECFAAETRFTISENPDTVLAPDFAFIKPEIVRRSVVLPAPLAPMRVTIEPSSTTRETPLIALIWP